MANFPISYVLYLYPLLCPLLYPLCMFSICPLCMSPPIPPMSPHLSSMPLYICVVMFVALPFSSPLLLGNSCQALLSLGQEGGPGLPPPGSAPAADKRKQLPCAGSNLSLIHSHIITETYYRSGTVNSNMVNSKFHLIRSYFEYLARIISCLRCTVNLNTVNSKFN